MKDKTFMSRLSSWTTEHSSRQAENWRRREATIASSLPKWRTESRTNLLIRLFFAALAFGFLTAVIQIFWPPFIFVWLPVTVATCVFWTMLRTVINTRDVAPSEELDEYESEIVRTWQVVAYGLFTMLTLAIAIYMVIVSTINPDSLNRWIYSGGLFTTLGLMTIIALPTTAYATTFGPVPIPRDAPEANSDFDTSSIPTRGAFHADPGA
ncbi:MAG TPA: hypothetical protein H9870_05035 [Candidatus Corynebacterium avicola]|uniref:Uncharacterized protein n=1 Tax=Candidatus Corynebacterium avicola TaxID=2838527 RepID=A0A9D1RMF6_9CORY|nr:hypothetical protein [Candidatus Corynebacterium avicola]